MQGLYQILPGHDWYAATILAIQLAMIAILTWYVVRKQKGWLKKILSIFVFYSVFILCWINEITYFTYTTAAALVGSAIIVVYALGEDRIGDYVVLCILCFLAYNLRSDLFFMILPICGILWIYKMLQNKNKKMQIGLLSAIILLIGGSFLCDYMAYSSEDWSNYMAYNKARTQVYDYAFEDIIQYDDFREMYEKIGISREQCKIIETYDLELYDDEVYDKMDEIAEAYKNPRSLRERMKLALTIIIQAGLLDSKMMTVVSGFLWILAIFYTCYSRNKKIAVMEVAFLAVHLILWFYLGYKGRILPRVSHSMLLVQIITPFISLCYLTQETEKKKIPVIWKKAGFVALGILVLAVSVYDVRLSQKLMHRNQKEVNDRDQYIIEEYCNAHKENFYFLDVFSVAECKYYFDFYNENRYENFVVLGDWFGNSPLYEAKMKTEGIKSVREAVLHDKSVYVIRNVLKDISFIKDITEENVTLKPVDFLDGGMDDYIVYSVMCE